MNKYIQLFITICIFFISLNLFAGAADDVKTSSDDFKTSPYEDEIYDPNSSRRKSNGPKISVRVVSQSLPDNKELGIIPAPIVPIIPVLINFRLFIFKFTYIIKI